MKPFPSEAHKYFRIILIFILFLFTMFLVNERAIGIYTFKQDAKGHITKCNVLTGALNGDRF